MTGKALILFLFLGAVSNAWGSCKDDVEKFCTGVERGGGRIMKCLKEHESELSEPCKAKRNKRAERKAQMKAARKTVRQTPRVH